MSQAQRPTLQGWSVAVAAGPGQQRQGGRVAVTATRRAQLPSALSPPWFSSAGRAGRRQGSESARTFQGPLPASQLPLASRLPLTTDVLTALPKTPYPLADPTENGAWYRAQCGFWAEP